MEVLRPHTAKCSGEETTAWRLRHDMLSNWILWLCAGISKHDSVSVYGLCSKSTGFCLCSCFNYLLQVLCELMCAISKVLLNCNCKFGVINAPSTWCYKWKKLVRTFSSPVHLLLWNLTFVLKRSSILMPNVSSLFTPFVSSRWNRISAPMCETSECLDTACWCCRQQRLYSVGWVTWHPVAPLIIGMWRGWLLLSCRSHSAKGLRAIHTAGSLATHTYFCLNTYITKGTHRHKTRLEGTSG